MKKLLVVLIGLIFVISMAGSPFAQEKAKPGKSSEAAKSAEAAKPAGPAEAKGAKPEAAKKVAPAKPVKYRMGGIVVGLDTATNTITLQQNSVKAQKKVKLSLSKKAARELSHLKVGDLVNVWVSGKSITALHKVY